MHQIELEMQNDELRRAQVELDLARARYFDLYDLAPVGYCTLSASGLIIHCNFTAVAMLGSTRSLVMGRLLARCVSADLRNLVARQVTISGGPACYGSDDGTRALNDKQEQQYGTRVPPTGGEDRR